MNESMDTTGIRIFFESKSLLTNVFVRFEAIRGDERIINCTMNLYEPKAIIRSSRKMLREVNFKRFFSGINEIREITVYIVKQTYNEVPEDSLTGIHSITACLKYGIKKCINGETSIMYDHGLIREAATTAVESRRNFLKEAFAEIRMNLEVNVEMTDATVKTSVKRIPNINEL
jgi:hypothetical protein